jgi:predicted nucleotidyltransferase
MNSDFRELLADLCRSRVRFLVVGGYAVMHHTEPRFTKDLDLWIEPNAGNAERLREALLRFGAWLEHMKVADFCEEGVMFQIGIPPVRVDFLTSVPGLEFSSCWERRDVATLGDTEVPMLGLADLIIAKERAGRRQDELDLEKLRQRAQEE